VRRALARLAALVCATGALAHAAPTIDVRARTRVGIDAAVRGAAGVHVRGSLVDALTGAGVSGRRVILSVDGHDVGAAVVNADGRFDVRLDLPTGVHDLAARFAGDDTYGETSAVPRPFDVDKAALALDVRVDLPAEANAPVLTAHLLAGSSEGPEAVTLAVRAGDAADPGTLRPVGEVRTNERGEASLDIPRERLGGPGEKRVVARFEGSDSWNPSEAEARFTLQTTTQLADVIAPPARLAYEAHLSISGRLLDADGHPLIGAPLALASAKAHLAETASDAEGRFTLAAAAADLGAGPAQLTVTHESTVPWRRGTRAGPFTTVIAPPEPVPATYSVLTFVLTLAAVLGYVVLRTRPWLRLAALARRRRRKPEAASAVGDQPDESAAAPGLRLARPSLISSLRRAGDHGFTGRVCDAVRGTPVGGARIVLVSPESGQRHELVTDEAGHFEIELAAGWWQAEVTAGGYVRETVRAPIPHRGELRGARVDLLPVREKVFAIYRQVAAPLLPKPELWGVWTPREILDRARGARPSGAFGQLTDLVEETYFSVRVPDEAVVGEAESHARAAAREVAPPG
jgi:hypothetical protein